MRREGVVTREGTVWQDWVVRHKAAWRRPEMCPGWNKPAVGEITRRP